MTKTLSMVSLKNDNSANEDFVIFMTSKSITCFINSFTSKVKYHSIAYLLNGNEHIYWVLDLEDEVHSRWVIRTSNLHACNDNLCSLNSRGADNNKMRILNKKNGRTVRLCPLL